MGKHTPGPWILDERFVKGQLGNSPRWVCEITCSNNNLIVAEIPEYRSYPEDTLMLEANARLIAAAPDLLEAVQMYAAVVGNTGHALSRESASELYEAAQRVIRKATGEPS